jgi:hypothetical protein
MLAAILIFAISFLLLVSSKSSIAALIFIVLFGLVIKGWKSRLTLAIFAIIFFLLYSDTIFRSFMSLDPSGPLATVFSRVVLWNYIFSDIIASNGAFLFGLGYGSASGLLGDSIWTDSDIDQSHNLLVESIVSVGVLGTSVVVWLIITIVKSRNHLQELGRSCVAAFTCAKFMLYFFLLRGLTEASIAQAGSADVGFFSFSLVIVSIYGAQDNSNVNF